MTLGRLLYFLLLLSKTLHKEWAHCHLVEGGVVFPLVLEVHLQLGH
jgi:hypothetical protein